MTSRIESIVENAMLSSREVEEKRKARTVGLRVHVLLSLLTIYNPTLPRLTAT